MKMKDMKNLAHKTCSKMFRSSSKKKEKELKLEIDSYTSVNNEN